MITLAFDPELAGLLGPAAARAAPRVSRVLPATTSVKDAVEAVGVPHCEIGSVVAADGSPRRLDDPVADGDVLRIGPVGRVDPGTARFACDAHLGTLARLLRTLGFDTTWDPAVREAELVRRGLNEGRIVLSGSRALLKRRNLLRAMLIRDDDPDLQLAAVARRYGLAARARPFARCPRCNGEVVSVPKADIADRIPPKTARWLDEYYRCAGCDQLYWEGTHVAALRARLGSILDGSR